MEPKNSEIEHLKVQLERLSRKQESLQQEISQLRELFNAAENAEKQITALKEPPAEIRVPDIPPPPAPITPPATEPEEEIEISVPAWKANLEKFIGENLINKIGILITVLGVAIGVKYAIDHELISPLTRIILGYLVAAGLLGFAIKLKSKYLNFSAVLFSGSMASCYFITYVAWEFYQLISFLPDFIILVCITVITVGAALWYNRQVIAHIGLTGAYAIPFLLNTGTGTASFLFTYMILINVGILVISLVRYWKPLLWSATVITWAVFAWWYVGGYDPATDAGTGMLFSLLFFLLFYVILLGYKVIRGETFVREDILLILSNSSVFFGLGFAMLHQHLAGQEFKGLFTLGNALVHGIFWGIVYMRRNADRALCYFIGGLAISFLTIAVPVQFDGQWVTLLWAAEMAMLFFLGRKMQVEVYEWISVPMILLVFVSLLNDWAENYMVNLELGSHAHVIPLMNILFGTSLFVACAYSAVCWLDLRVKMPSTIATELNIPLVINIMVPVLLGTTLFFSFFFEINYLFNQMVAETRINIGTDAATPSWLRNNDLFLFKKVALLAYSGLFMIIFSALNLRYWKNQAVTVVSTIAALLVLTLILTFGLMNLGELRENYINREQQELFHPGPIHIAVRYIVLLVVAILLAFIWRNICSQLIPINFIQETEIIVHMAVLTMISNELINWMDLLDSHQTYKLGLSILFGVYSLFLIMLGILQRKKYLRISAMALFGGTLGKLFLYDLANLDTISKTIVFLSLGILLLIISFLYNKYTKKIFEEHSP